MQQIAVIGLGRFGTVLAQTLHESGVQVLGIDNSVSRVNDLGDELDRVVALDSTDRSALASQAVDEVDVAVVAIGEAFEAALLTTVILKKMGVAKVICRAQTPYHAEIFKQVGADEVIQPEVQAGSHLARRLAHPKIDDFVTLSEGFAIIEIRTPAQFVGKALKDLALRTTYDVNVVAVRPKTVVQDGDGERREVAGAIAIPRPSDMLTADDVLVVIGSEESLARLPKE